MIKMKNIELEVVKEHDYYTESFQGRWIIDPEELLRVDEFYDDDPMRIQDQGNCCAVAQKDTGALVFYGFHKNGLRDAYMVEFDPIEGVGLDASDEVIISTIKEMLDLQSV